MSKQMIMGNQAIALGALKAGVNLVAGYPGTPSSEIIEFISKYNKKTGTYVEWSINEKAAVEVAAGASYAGSRTLVTMKQVGLNVAADPVMCLSYVGIKGGMVIVSADDPGPISSQTEQDTRNFAQYSKLPCFDPSTPLEAYEMVQEAFEYSEKYNTPVFLRPTTRVDHAYESMEFPELAPCRTPGTFEKDSKRWVIFPRSSYNNHKRIFERNESILPEEFSKSKWNFVQMLKQVQHDGKDTIQHSENTTRHSELDPRHSELDPRHSELDLRHSELDLRHSELDLRHSELDSESHSFAAGGISYCYLMEALSILKSENPENKAIQNAKVLKIGTPYPFPVPMAVEFMKENSEITVFEELDPVIEDALIHICGTSKIDCKIHGKHDKTVPEAGELSVEIVKGIVEKILKQVQDDTFTIQDDTFTIQDDGNFGEMLKQVQHDELPRHSEPDPRHSELAPRHSELAPRHSELAPRHSELVSESPELPVRPPVLCAGCPHRGSFYAVKQAMKGQKTAYCGDIGCYTLGNAMPLDMTDTCLCMGADITMAQGFYHNENDRHCFSFIGDSTFFASGITGVANAVYNQAKQTICILDNSTTAMTGHQPHPGTGVTMMGEIVEKISIPKILEAIGVNPIIEVDPFNQEKAIEAVKQADEAPGVSAIIFKSPCISIAGKLGYKFPGCKNVDTEKCIGCRKCINELGCPALSLSTKTNSKGKQLVEIDKSLCTGCGLCAGVCPAGAIK